MFRRFADWFTPHRRQSIQGALAGVVTLLVTLGALTQGESQDLLIFAAIVFQAGSGLLALAYLESPGVMDIWTIIRGVLYTLAGSLAPFLVAIGMFSIDDGNTFTALVGVSLSIVGSIVAIFTGKKQEAHRLDAEYQA